MDDDSIQSFDPSFFSGSATPAPTPEQDTSTPLDAAVGDLNIQATQRVAAGEDPDVVQADLAQKIGKLPKTKVDTPKEGKVMSFDPSFFTPAKPSEVYSTYPQIENWAGPVENAPMATHANIGPDVFQPPSQIQGIGDYLSNLGTEATEKLRTAAGGVLQGLGEIPQMGRDIAAKINTLGAFAQGGVPMDAAVQAVAEAQGAPADNQLAQIGQFEAAKGQQQAELAAGHLVPAPGQETGGLEQAAYYGQQALVGAPTMVAAMGAGPVGGAALFGASTAGEAYAAKRAEGEQPLSAAASSAIQGSVSALTASLSLESALNPGAIGALRRIAETTGSVEAQSVINEATAIAAEQTIDGKDISGDEIQQRLMAAAKGGIPAGVLMGGVGAYTHYDPAASAAARVNRLADQIIGPEPARQTLAERVSGMTGNEASDLIAQGQRLQESINAGEVPEVTGAVPGAGAVEGGLAQGGQTRGPAPPAETVPAEQIGEQPAANLQQPENVVAPVVPAAEGAAGAAPAQAAAGVPAAEPATFFARSDTAGATTPAEVADALRAWREQGTDSPYFQSYFEGSKVVDANEAPKVVYHGTGEDFSVFDNTKLGDATQHATSPLGHFFTENPVLAKRYAANAAEGVPANERVVNAYLSIKNPYEMPLSEAQDIETPQQALAVRQKLQAQGYDGIRIPEAKSWIAFDSSQIKDTGNRGTFDITNPDIRYARAETPAPSDNLTREQARNVLAQEWGTTALRKLEANGLNLVSRDEMATHPATQGLTPEQRAGVTGFTPPDKSSANVVHDNVTKEGLLNDTVHEIVHANLDRILDPKTRNNLANAIVQRGKVNAEVAAALKKIPYSTPKENRKEEILAQTMGDLYSQPIGRKVVDAFKLGLNRVGVPLNWINAHEAAIRQIGIDNLRHFAEATRREQTGTTYTVAPPAAGSERKPKPRIRLTADQVPVSRTEEVNVPQEGGTAGGPGVRAGDVGAGPARVREAVAAARPTEAGAGDAGTAAGQPATGRVGEAGVVPPATPEGVTSIKNAATTAQRAKRSLGPIEKQLGNDFGENNDQAAAKLASNPGYGEELAASLVAKPRPHTDVETAILLRDQVRLQNEHADAMKRAEQAMDSGDDVEAMAARMKAREVEAKLEVNEKAGTYAGSMLGRGLNSRRMAMNEDMSLARVITRARVLNGGDIPADIRTKLENLTKQLADRDEQINKLQEAQKATTPAPRKARTPAEKKTLDDEFNSLADQLRKLAKPQTATAFARVEDARMAAIIRKMARNRSDAGETDPVKIVDAIHEQVGDAIGVPKQDIADTISNYGAGRQPTKDELQIRYNAIKRELADLSRTQDTLTGKIDTGAAKDQARQTALRTEIEDLDRRINYRDAMKPEKAPPAYSETTQTLRAARDAKKQELRNIEPSPAPTKPADLTRAQLRKTNPERAKELDKQDRLQSEIDKIDEAIAAGGTKERGKVQGPDSEAVARLRAERVAKKQELDSLRPASEAATKRNQTRISQLQRQIADIRSRLQRGDYSKPERRKPVYDPQVNKLQAERNELARRVRAELEKIRQGTRSPTEKFIDFGLNLRRAVILSSVKTLGKLTSAAALRSVSTPLEEVAGSALTNLPIPGVRGSLRRIAAKAPREGGVSGRAEAQALSHQWSREMLGEAGKKLRTGLDSLDVLYGGARDFEQTHTWLDYIGQLHGALKTPAKINEFYRSIEKRADFERNRVIAEGMTPEQADAHMQNPETIAMLGAKAYVDANRSIFMQDNAAVSAYKVMLGYLARAGAEGSMTRAFSKTAEKTGRYLLPIVRIPTNFVAEAGSYGLGSAKALGQVIAAKGIEHLTPDQADYVMRNLKKQTIGAVLMFMGYNMAGSIGGYYQRGDNKKTLPQKEGEITIGGVTIPKFLTHNPAMEMLQIGATIRRVAEAEAHKKKGAESPMTAGVFAGVKGLLSEVPFIDTPGRLQEGFSTYQNFSKFLGNEVRGAFIPPDVQNVARAMDTAKQRKPKNFTQEIESGLPVLRENVPTK